MKFIDSHAHLDFEDFHPDFDAVLDRAEQAGVFKIVNIGADLKRSEVSIYLAGQHENIFATIGVHPEEAMKTELSTIESELERLLESSRRIVAIGECGLDYFYSSSKDEREKQRLLFEAQIQVAQRHHLPMVIHIRNGEDKMAYEDAVAILLENKVSHGVVHCYTFDACDLKPFLDLGLHIGFTGIITYKNAENIREAVAKVPMEKILIETDCPFLSPQVYRGKRNEPSYVVEVAKQVAEIKNLELSEVARQTTENAEKLFGI